MTQETSLPPISAPETPPPGLIARLRRLSLQHIVTSQKFLIGIFIVLILSTAIITLAPRYQFQAHPTPAPLATPAPTPQASSLPDSPFATDSAILQIEQDLNNLQNHLNQTDMDEKRLLPPNLDLNVSFK